MMGFASLQPEEHTVMRAAEDYQRLRTAYLALAREEDRHDVALAMIGADMERAHHALQSLAGVRTAPFTPLLRRVMRREGRRLGEPGA
jgi:hypothetical protein